MKDLTITERELYHAFVNAYFMGSEEFRNQMFSHVSDMWITLSDKAGCTNTNCRKCEYKEPCDVYYYLTKGMEYINEHETSLAGLAIDQIDNND